MPTPVPSSDESTDEVLARAECWARGGRIDEAVALCRALLPRLVDPVASGTCEHIVALSRLHAGRSGEPVQAGDGAIRRPEDTDAVERLLAILALQAGELARPRRNEEPRHGMTPPGDEAGVSRRRAKEDPLTGLSNRRQLETSVEQLLQQFPETPLTLLIADIDHFRRINDTWSHATGDAVLEAVADVLRAQSRPQDILARIGGEEFVVALGGPVSMTRAMLVAERLRAAIEAHDWESLQPGMAVTASIGVAACAPGESLNAALDRADAALNECKRGGRNQARCSS